MNPHGRYKRTTPTPVETSALVSVTTICPSCHDQVVTNTTWPATITAFPPECVTCEQYREDENASLARIYADNCALFLSLADERTTVDAAWLAWDRKRKP